MTVSVHDTQVGSLRWLTLIGPREELFTTLGEAAAEEVHAVLDGLPESAELRRFAASPAGRDLVGSILAATRARHPRELQEARDLAAGARYDPDALLLANLRGDLGRDDLLGCTDLAYVGQGAFVAHNEDGAPALEGRLMLVTLAADGEPPLTVQWYPGFLPGNTFVATGRGLVWGVDHLHVPAPAVAPGRAFVARALQHQPTLDAAVRFLEEHPSAGGFAYTFGALGAGRVVSVETAAGDAAVVEAAAQERPFLWHANHALHLGWASGETGEGTGSAGRGTAPPGLVEESRMRARVVQSLIGAAPGVGVDWFLEVLARRPVPHGVRRSAEGADPLMTLCTTVVDLIAGEVTLEPRGAPVVTLPAEAYVAGGA